MANPFAGTETYDVELVDASDGEKWTVTLRPLNAGHQAKLLDQMAVEAGETEDGEVTRPRLGTVKLLLVSAAVVRWTLPQPATPHTIAELRPDLFDQIYEATKFAGDDLGNRSSSGSTTSPEPSTTTSTTTESPAAAAAPAGAGGS
jgi:hypothetical protein